MQPHPLPDDKALSLCPLAAFRDQPGLERKAFSLHLNWTKGILPVPGGMDDQAADFEITVAAVEHGLNAGQARLQEVAQRKAERDGNKGTSNKRHRR